MSSGTPEESSTLAQIIRLLVTHSFSFISTESNRAITSEGSTGNMCVTAVLLYTNEKKKNIIMFLRSSQYGIVVKITMEVFHMKVATQTVHVDLLTFPLSVSLSGQFFIGCVP